MLLNKKKRFPVFAEEQEKASLGNPMHFTVDYEANICILYQAGHLKTINQNGETELIPIAERLRDVETNSATPMILSTLCVDDDNNMLVLSFYPHATVRRINRFSRNFQIAEIFEIPYDGSQVGIRGIISLAHNEVVLPSLCGVFRESAIGYHNALLDKYDYHGNFLFSFGQVPLTDTLDMRKILQRGSLARDPQDHVYFSFDYPYKFLKFDKAGALLDSFNGRQLPYSTREPSFTKALDRQSKTLTTKLIPQNLSKSITIGNHYICNLISLNVNELAFSYGTGLDVYSPSGNFIGCVEIETPATNICLALMEIFISYTTIHHSIDILKR